MRTRKVFPVIFMILLGPITSSLAVAMDDDGKLFVNSCAACHTVKKQPLDKKRLTREGWDEAVARMICYGAEIPKGKLAELLDYLVRSQKPGGSVDGMKK